jgi:tRNA (guanine26-N2/guanine27-N2)-dimethyltransferase
LKHTEIREGSTRLLVPSDFCRKGPGRNTGGVFYNRQMEFGRDISVMLSEELLDGRSRALDGLAATGARGIRMANEGGSGAAFVLNDKNEEAFHLMEKNVALNGPCSGMTVMCRDLRALLAEEGFSYIDIDPFGTPVDFIDAAVQSCRNGGTLAVTATDTAPLCGTYPRTSSRRYGARSQRSKFSHETGLRILIGYVAREAAKHDRGCEPTLCYSADHYFRCHVRISKGARKADDSLSRLGYALHDPKTLVREVVRDRPVEDASFAGPLWTGDLHDGELLKSLTLKEHLGTRRRCEKMLRLWQEEVGMPPLHYVVDELAQRARCQPPRMTTLVDRIRELGAKATLTHFDPKGFKTDLPLDELVRLFADTCK